MATNHISLDRPEVLAVLFHPRPEVGSAPAMDTVSDHLISVDGAQIGARFHLEGPQAANILFFHGNGEIVADYDPLGPIFNQRGMNLLAVDYRGYGRSSGHPTVHHMLHDCHAVFDYARNYLSAHAHTGPLIVMGRSLGSASALELAAARPQSIDGLVIESGFADAVRLLQKLGVDIGRLGLEDGQGLENLENIKKYDGPTLIIHAERDHIIDFADGEALFEASPSPHKQLLKIEGANHNDIFMRGFNAYMQSLQALVQSAASG